MNSGIGGETSMIAANHRIETSTSTSKRTTPLQQAHTYGQLQHLSTLQPHPKGASEMQDEYGEMDSDGHTFVQTDFLLENGKLLPQAQLRYQTYGELNPETRDNVLVVCHALTGNASLHSWWGDLLGDGNAFDTSKYFVVCCNILGSCYGSTCPQSIDPRTAQPYGKDFPDVSVQDTVKLQLMLLQKELGIKSVASVIGGSFGGMQAVEFAVQAGSPAYGSFFSADGSPFVKSVIPIACGMQHTAWQIAVSEVQRQAIYADPAWMKSSNPIDATSGLQVARQIGMVSYRTPQGYQGKFGREIQQPAHTDESNSSHPSSPALYGSNAMWKAKSYLQYQGQKFLSRFDPVTYVKMTEQMDSHDVTRGRGPDVLQQVPIPALILGIDSDVLYPLEEQEEMAQLMPGGILQVIHSNDGHDGFLLEQEQVSRHITQFLEKLQES